MIEKTKYPKTARDFEKWYNETYTKFFILLASKWFSHLPEEMQVGVYQKYFDEHKINIEPAFIKKGEWYCRIWVDPNSSCTKYYNDRIPAIIAAIPRAAAVREKQLEENEA